MIVTYMAYFGQASTIISGISNISDLPKVMIYILVVPPGDSDSIASLAGLKKATAALTCLYQKPIILESSSIGISTS